MNSFFNNFIHGAPDEIALIASSILLIIGIVIWLFGARLVRPVCVITALAIGGLGGFVLSKGGIINSQYMLPMIIACAILAGMLSWLLFRLWVAVVGAGVLAVVVPVAALAWQGVVPPQIPHPNSNSKTAVAKDNTPRHHHKITVPNSASTPSKYSPQSEQTTFAQTQTATRPQSPNNHTKQSLEKNSPNTTKTASKENQLDKVSTAAAAFYNRQAQALSSWWRKNRDQIGSQLVYVSIAIAIAVGLALGLIAPYVASSLESAIIGAILIFFSATSMLKYLSPGSGGFMPTQPRPILFILALIALVGFLFQWTVFHKPED